jgi:hypothetical protein
MLGSKFVEDSIIFKIILDDYGGLYEGSVEKASKAAVHELKSLNEIGKLIIGERKLKKSQLVKSKSQVEGFFLPLVCLVRYSGFTFICASILPLNKV